VREFRQIAKALADPNRVRVVLALRRRELCVCQIAELLRLSLSTISKHLSILHHAGLIESRKEERWVFYRLPGKQASVMVRKTIEWAQKSLVNSLGAEEDHRRVKQILNASPTTICQRRDRR
jgi:ArsR family transcriptional regulator, arsenate/arsenite/antimonite-responsive transcriptional repressor